MLSTRSSDWSQQMIWFLFLTPELHGFRPQVGPRIVFRWSRRPRDKRPEKLLLFPLPPFLSVVIIFCVNSHRNHFYLFDGFSSRKWCWKPSSFWLWLPWWSRWRQVCFDGVNLFILTNSDQFWPKLYNSPESSNKGSILENWWIKQLTLVRSMHLDVGGGRCNETERSNQVWKKRIATSWWKRGTENKNVTGRPRQSGHH